MSTKKEDQVNGCLALFNNYVNANKVKRRKDYHVCLYRLISGKKCPEWKSGHICDSPVVLGLDHASEWVKDGKTFAITFHPYGLSHQHLVRIINFCEEKGLELKMEAFSWHFPGRTLLAELRRKL